MAVVRVKTKMNPEVAQRIREAMRDPMRQAASSIARAAKASIKKRSVSGARSLPGRPPTTIGGRHSLKKSIVYSLTTTKEEAVVGPAYGGTGLTGHYHEFGGSQARKPSAPRKLRMGKPGPVFNSDGAIIWRKIRTRKEMVASQRALDEYTMLNEGRAAKVNVYPQRPFMAPAFVDVMSRQYKNFKIRA